MRLWLGVDPSKMCRRHLLGEHCETRMFVGTINKGISIRRYLEKNLLEPLSLEARHNLLAAEMIRRGMNHNHSLPPIDWKHLTVDELNWKIDQQKTIITLLERCTLCRKNLNTTP